MRGFGCRVGPPCPSRDRRCRRSGRGWPHLTVPGRRSRCQAGRSGPCAAEAQRCTPFRTRAAHGWQERKRSHKEELLRLLRLRLFLLKPSLTYLSKLKETNYKRVGNFSPFFWLLLSVKYFFVFTTTTIYYNIFFPYLL